jgi:hypothetical protein
VQLELLDCDWSAFWVVDAVLLADEDAELVLFCEAELDPPDTEPPAIVTGTFALTPFWSAFASELADCVVDASCDVP